jgi:acyl-coenzyme A thioesterase PaaI-like protein
MYALAEDPVFAADLAFFAALPCFQRYYQKPNLYHATDFISQQKDPHTTSNSFFNETIRSPSTITRAVTLINRNLHDADPDTTAVTKTVDHTISTADPAFLLFVQIGKGLNGFSDTVHGGVLASLIDETLSICAETCKAQSPEGRSGVAVYTANLNVSYHIPVLSPGVLYIRAWVRQRVGRKWFLDAELLNEREQICVSAKSLWISTQRNAQLAEL